MMLWLIAAFMTAVALGLVLRPLLGVQAKAEARANYDLAVYRDQLTEIDRDIARGLLSGEQAKAARIEIERRILAAIGDAKATPSGGPAPVARLTAMIVAIVGPLAALGLYLHLGLPGLPAHPFESRAALLATDGETGGESPTSGADLAALTRKLADRMAANPDDPAGWQTLARAYSTLGQFDKSAEAYDKTIEHGANDAAIHSARGEALVMRSDGQVIEAARQAFETAMRIDSKDSRARYYLGLAEAQAGRLKPALDQWLRLEADGAPEAPWRKDVAAQIDQTARALGLDPATLPGRPPPPETSPGPNAGDMAAAADMAPEEREVLIRGMVEGLAERMKNNPDDLAGWRKLGRAYVVLGDFASARDAWARAAALAPSDTEVLLGYAEALVGNESDDTKLPAEFAPLVERIRTIAPDNKLGLFFAGLVERAAGRTAEARILWRQLIDQLPAGSPDRALLQRRLDALDSGG